MLDPLILLIIVVILALVFDYVNGFHDSANAIATVVATRVLSPRVAVILAGVLNIFGALLSTEVAKTVGKDIVKADTVTQLMIVSALVGAIAWNIITWYFGIPSSSSHALVGGLAGAVLFSCGVDKVNWKSITGKVVVPGLVSPLIGLLIGFITMVILLWAFRRANPYSINKKFRHLQIYTASAMALSHGFNDAQKSMGIVTLALVAYVSKYGLDRIPLFLHGLFPQDIEVPLAIKLACALLMGLGTASGGWRIIKTMGVKSVKLQPIQGFAAEAASSIVLFTTGHFGMPVSTTHVICSSILGAGASKRLSAVRWGLAGNILVAWFITLPAAALMAGLSYHILKFFF